MKKGTLLNPDFKVGNLADDLVAYTIEICGKKQDNSTRFPKYLYPTYVDRIIRTALDIQRDVFIANSAIYGDFRTSHQKAAASNCVYLQHIIRIASDNGWISEKQREQWQNKIFYLRRSIVSWYSTEQ